MAWVHADQAKAGKALPVPLNSEAVVLIRKWLGKHPTHVFSYRGEPITQMSIKAWYAALKRAGIEDFRWHDLRHYPRFRTMPSYASLAPPVAILRGNR